MSDTYPEINTRWELFVDRYLIEEEIDTALFLHCPERREMAFVADQPWEDNTFFPQSVIEEKDRVRMFYRAFFPNPKDEASSGVAIADSFDGGLTFTRPELGLTAFEGSKKNNLLAVAPPPHTPPASRNTP